MKIAAIIQARIGSTRLPGKILMPLAEKQMLWHIVERVKRAKWIDCVYVAIPHSDAERYREQWGQILDDPIICELNTPENDLISRYYKAAKMFDADLIVRICADNPFVEPEEIDRAIEYYMKNPCIYVSNMHNHDIYAMNLRFSRCNEYPDGIGCEVFSFSRLQWMNENIEEARLREHPHRYFHEKGLIDSPPCPSEFARPNLKLDVNTQEEYEYVKDIYEHLYPQNPNFHVTEVMKYLGKKDLS